MGKARANQQAGDRLAAALAAAALPVARSRPLLPLDAPELEDVDVISALSHLGQAIPEFCRRAMLGEITSADWEHLAEILGQAQNLCLAQRVIDAKVIEAGE